MLMCGTRGAKIDRDFADATKGPMDLRWAEYNAKNSLNYAAPAGQQPTLTAVYTVHGDQGTFWFGHVGPTKSVLPKYIGHSTPCTSQLDTACSWASGEPGSVLMKPGVIHNNHYSDAFTIIFKRTVCLTNDYLLPDDLKTDGGQRCFAFKQSRCYRCSDDAYNFVGGAGPHNNLATDADLIKIMECPAASLHACDSNRLVYYDFQVGGF